MLGLNLKGVIGKELKYGFYLAVHPMRGFWEMKNEDKVSLQSAWIIIMLFFLSVLCKRQLTAWQFNPAYTEYLNVWNEFIMSVGPYAIWCVSSWCVTSLMDGQGTMKDIIRATAFSLLPLLFTNFLGVIISHLVVEREVLLYSIITNAGLYWTLGLIFLSIVSIHEYTVFKSIAVTVISIVGMLMIAGLGILLFYLVQQLLGFGMEVWKEFSLRIAE
ncbi:MAG: hypothetical protein E7255_03085 [Lachnospiraceae bacterium]|nr:hypothetical protein [Lachnospiraceae bacterium]